VNHNNSFFQDRHKKSAGGKRKGSLQPVVSEHSVHMVYNYGSWMCQQAA